MAFGYLESSDVCSVRSVSRWMRDSASPGFSALFHHLHISFTLSGLERLEAICADEDIRKSILLIRFTLPTPILTHEFKAVVSSRGQSTAVRHALENTKVAGKMAVAGAGPIESLVSELHTSTSIHAMMWNGEAVLMLVSCFQRTPWLEELQLHEGGTLANRIYTASTAHGIGLPSSPAAAIFTALVHAKVQLKTFRMIYDGHHAHPHGISLFDLHLRMPKMGEHLRLLDISITAPVSGTYTGRALHYL